MRKEAVSGWAAHMRPAFAPFAHPCAARLAVSQSALRAALATAYGLQPTACKCARRS